MRVLMVEDDHLFGGLVRDALRMSGHEVRQVPTAESGIGALLQHRYDVLLLDLDLGMTRGEAMVGRMRNLGESVPPIVILSGQSADVIAAATKTTGAIAAVRKPCPIDELLAILGDASARWRTGEVLPPD